MVVAGAKEESTRGSAWNTKRDAEGNAVAAGLMWRGGPVEVLLEQLTITGVNVHHGMGRVRRSATTKKGSTDAVRRASARRVLCCRLARMPS